MKSDFYMKFKNFYDRLEDDYRQFHSIIIAYDFDDTVSNFSKFKFKKADGYKNDNIIKLLQDFKDHAYFILFTVRNTDEDLAEAKEYIERNNIPLNAINKNKPTIPFNCDNSKIYYHILLDDKAGLKWPYKALRKLLRKIKSGKIS